MASLLKELSVALGLLTSDNAPVANADGWQNYVWRIRTLDHCKETDKTQVEDRFCTLPDDKWDWKRPQHYAFSFLANSTKNSITARLQLRNEDPTDVDRVCIVAIFTDQKGEDVAVFYQNWLSLPGRTVVRDIPLLPSLPVSSIATVAIGSKQCDGASPKDAETFYRNRLRLKQR